MGLLPGRDSGQKVRKEYLYYRKICRGEYRTRHGFGPLFAVFDISEMIRSDHLKRSLTTIPVWDCSVAAVIPQDRRYLSEGDPTPTVAY
jgi:hypothetical protein